MGVDGAWLRQLALSLPEVEERETWGEATFRVRDRIFVMMGPDGRGASVKATLDDQAALVGAAPETYSVSAYTGRFGWVSVRLETAGPEVLRRLVVDAWRRTAPKRLVAAHDLRTASGGGPAPS
jgi:hypothetical protein